MSEVPAVSTCTGAKNHALGINHFPGKVVKEKRSKVLLYKCGPCKKTEEESDEKNMEYDDMNNVVRLNIRRADKRAHRFCCDDGMLEWGNVLGIPDVHEKKRRLTLLNIKSRVQEEIIGILRDEVRELKQMVYEHANKLEDLSDEVQEVATSCNDLEKVVETAEKLVDKVRELEEVVKENCKDIADVEEKQV